jgi:hypothetical protein
LWRRVVSCVQEVMAKRSQSSQSAGAARWPEMPGFIKPQLATLRSKAPVGPQWLHEIKFDGYRVQVHLNKGKRKVYTRNGLDWTKRFSQIAGALDIPGWSCTRGAPTFRSSRPNSSINDSARFPIDKSSIAVFSNACLALPVEGRFCLARAACKKTRSKPDDHSVKRVGRAGLDPAWAVLAN